MAAEEGQSSVRRPGPRLRPGARQTAEADFGLDRLDRVGSMPTRRESDALIRVGLGGGWEAEWMLCVVSRLGSGNLRQAVVLPEGEDLNEWLAVNSKPHDQSIPITLALLLTRGAPDPQLSTFSTRSTCCPSSPPLCCATHLRPCSRSPAHPPASLAPRRYGTVTEFCTPQECPMMCAGPRSVLSSGGDGRWRVGLGLTSGGGGGGQVRVPLAGRRKVQEAHKDERTWYALLSGV